MNKKLLAVVIISLFSFGMFEIAGATVIQSAQYNGKTYYLLDKTDTWQQSEDEAVGLGGHLATINSAEENEWILSTFRQAVLDRVAGLENILPALWIGFIRNRGTSNWYWLNGEQVTFTNWASTQPANSWDEVTTGMLIRNEGSGWEAGRWHDMLDPRAPHDYDYGIVEVDKIISFTITASAGTGGTISPSGSISVNSGESKTFSIAPASCYDIDNVLVNGSTVTLTNGQYTFQSVTANQTISASFRQNPCCTYSVQTQVDAARQEGIQSCKDNPAGCGLLSQAQSAQAVKNEQLKWDANGDGRIGLEDIIRMLQVLAGLRP